MPDVQNTSDYKLSKSGRKIRAHKIVFNKGEEEQMKTPQVNEVLSKDDPASKWIKHFVHSDNPKFEEKSKKKRINMALGAYYAAQRSGVKEDIDMEVVSIAEMIDRVRETLEEEQDSKHFEIYDAKTSKALHTFKAKHMSHANIKADDWLESQGKTGKGLKVRPAKQGVAEEVDLEEEQLDELKKSTLMRYASKATKSAIGLGVKAARARDEGDMATWAKNRNKAEKRDRNVQKAIGKMRSEEVENLEEVQISKYRHLGANSNTTHFIKNTKTGEVVSPHRGRQDAEDALTAYARDSKGNDLKIVRAIKEGEQIDELSSSTIDSYRKKLGAKIDTTRTSRPSVQAAIKAKNAPIQAKIHNALMKQHQAIRRERGMSEEVEQLDEIGDTPAGKRALRAVQNRAADTMSDPSKSSKEVNKAVGAGVSAGNRLHGFGHDRMKKNTVMGRDALRKQLGVKEEAEQIDEVDDKRPGWMLRADPKLAAKLRAKQKLAKARQAAYGNPEAGKSMKEEVEQIEEVELVEAVQVSHDRYMRSHGKMASGKGQWLFTHKRSGDVNYRNDSEVHQANGSFSDAKKSAKMWAQKHGHSTVYVME